MTNLYAEWKKLRDNVQSASARLYLEKNENTEREYEEALERLGRFEKENGIPLMADESKVKKMFCPQTNEEWRKTCSTEEFAEFLSDVVFNAIVDYRIDKNNCEKEDGNYWLKWLKRSHKRKDDD